MDTTERAITSLRIALEEALAKQEQDEPVGYFKREGDVWFQYYEDYPVPSELTPLYTTPQPAQKPWVGLTDEDLRQIILAAVGVAEAKLKDKNGL